MPDDHLKLGRGGERLAAEHVRGLGYEILDRNVKTGGGELDLVARDGKVLVFIEVKTRTDLEKGNPVEAVTPAKQRKLVRAAEAYIAFRPPIDLDVRFDVIGIDFCTPDGQPHIDHVVNAFYVDG